jgi:N-acetylmuramic acid 6-phosphate etherase
MPTSRANLLTESRNERSTDIESMTVFDAFDVIATEDAAIAGAVQQAKPEICKTVGLVVDAFRRGGRLIYIGAGTSGRLGVLDAAECPPTFQSDPRSVRGIIAGGWMALRKSIEGAEDRAQDGATAIDNIRVDDCDVVLGIATGGTTPYVHAAIDRANELGARTVFFACVPVSQVADKADVSIRVLTGPEIITGSTRMKAGTATKMTLNAISTLSMIQIGKVYENLMVDVNARACDKLWDRAIRIVQTVTDLNRDRAEKLLRSADGNAKTAIVMHLANLERNEAEHRLESASGSVRKAIAPT